MADAEEKKISRLDFGIDKAISSLDKIDKKLKTVSETSEQYAKTIGKAINSGVDKQSVDKNISAVQKSYDKMSKYERNRAADVAAYRQKQEIKTTETLKREHAKQIKSVETLSDKISNYAKTYLIYQGFNMLKNTISDVIEEMVELENQMVQIDRVLNESDLSIDEYTNDLLNLAYEYGNSMDNVTDIALRLAQAGYSSSETLKLTEKTLLALNTAELNATQATDDMVAVMAQWGLNTGTATEKAEAYASIIDKVNKVADNYPTTSADLMDALKKTSSAFNLAGASIDETIALITAAEVASQRGGKAIGTALGNITQQLKDEKRLTIAESLGLDFYTDETKTQFKDITDIFGEMSVKMQELKDAGKESSVEMQQLLSIFTVFRRNVGASLLGEMSGEDSTYLRVLEDSLNATGYSLQENEKYMRTTKAAQEQFNATLLKLKTEVWDAGVEDTYKSMLVFGEGVANNIQILVKEFGALPVIVGTVTLAFSLLSKKMKIATLDVKTSTIQLQGFAAKIQGMGRTIKTIGLPKALRETANVSNISFKTMIKNLSSYEAGALAAYAKTMLLKAGVVALNISAAAAATAGMMLLVSIIQELANKTADAIQLQEASIQSTEQQIEKRQEEVTTLEELMKTYDELGTKEKRSPEETTKLLETQIKIKDMLGEQADTIDLINGKYEEQKNILSGISAEKRKELLEEKKKLMEQKKNAGVGYELPSFVQQTWGDKNYEDVLMEYGGTGLYKGSLKKTLENSNIEHAIEMFTKWEENLRSVQGESVELQNTYNWVNETLNKLTDSTKESDEATRDYYETLAAVKLDELFPEGSIKSAEHYEDVLKGLKNVAEGSTGDFKTYQDTLVDLFQKRFPEFAQETENTAEKIKEVGDANDYVVSRLESLANQMSILETAEKELNSTGTITVSTFKNLVDNELLGYLEVVNGKIVVNTASMKNMAEQHKIAAIEQLKEAAATDIQNLALGKTESLSTTAKNAIANFGNNTATAGNKASTAASKIAELAVSIAQAIAAANETAEATGIEDFQAKANAIANAYKAAAKKIGAITISSASGSSGGSRSSGGSSGSSSGSKEAEAKRKEEEKKKKEEEKYKKRLDKFTETLDKMTDEEEDWVRKQQELGMLSNKDMLYVTKQRISRYNKYLDTIKKATWMNKEDRKELMKQYTEEIEDLELEYFEYLKAKLDEEVEAVEDARDKKIKALEDEYDKKIKKVEDAADAEIKALQKVEDERDRLREKEDYESERQGILDEIAYWEQRTGREAVEALADAKKRLEELDQEWERTQEDWKTEDAIKKIEEETEAKVKGLELERDQKIKTAEETAKKEIELLQKGYNDKVKIFSETDKIIYDNSTISAKKLYKTYKDEFVDPLTKDLKNINKTDTNKNNDKKDDKKDEYITYTIKSGDTLSAIAKKYNTTVKKIMAANDYIKDANKIYAGKKLKIPKFHDGGIVGGNEEAFALLKPHEVILKPEWAEGINKLAMMAKNNETITNNSHNITVKGDLVRIDANIKDKNDAEYLTRKIEKMLKDKFNIKK